MIAHMPSISLQDVTSLDSQTTLVLTVNNRHARRLVAEFSASLNDQQRVMALPDILPLVPPHGKRARLGQSLVGRHPGRTLGDGSRQAGIGLAACHFTSPANR